MVLFKVKEDATQSEIDSMVERINSLVTLEKPQPLHLTMGPILVSSIRSSSLSPLNFTHILHIRFRSKEDLHAFAVHPTHVAAIKANAPLVVDIMALDWVSEVQADQLVLPPGSALRVAFFKLKEGLGEQVKDEVLKGISGIRHEKVVQFTFGENFSVGRDKGFSFASAAVFAGLSELQEADSDEEFGNYYMTDKIKENLDTVLLLDYLSHRQTTS